MIETISTSEISGSIDLPGSKSYFQRAVACALLCSEETTIVSSKMCEDSGNAVRFAADLGANILNLRTGLKMIGGLNPKKKELSVGESGLGVRMFSPIVSLMDQTFTLKGEGTLVKRPMNMITEALSQFGVHVETSAGYMPISIKGPLKGGKAIIDGSMSSQLLTGLLIALSAAENDSELVVNDLVSKPYIGMTIEILGDFGIEIDNENYKKFFIKGGQKFRSADVIIERDWSSAAFFAVAAATTGEVELVNMNINSIHPDRKILEVLRNAGASVSGYENINIVKGYLRSFILDITDCPDLLPVLAVLASACDGESKITGITRLKYKESNRPAVLQKVFSRIGMDISIDKDEMIINNSTITGGTVDPHNDHRIAMAAAVAGLISENEVKIINAECVAKSYPDFFKDLKSVSHKGTKLQRKL